MSHSDTDPIDDEYCPHGVPWYLECPLCESLEENNG